MTAGKGCVISEATRKKMSESAKKKVFSASHRAALSKASKGRKLSKEHKENISRARRGKPVPSRRGVPLSEECKKNISKALKGQKHSKEHMEKFQAASALAREGRIVTDEQREKHRISAKKMWKSPEYRRKRKEALTRKRREKELSCSDDGGKGQVSSDDFC